MDADLDTLATALYVRADDLLKACPERAPARPRVGIAPRLTDAGLVTRAVRRALPDRTGEAALAARAGRPDPLADRRARPGHPPAER